MYNKTFGNKKKSFGGGRDWKPMHDATCASCGTNCQVPFKPNGRKPVLCSNCFKRDGGHDAPRFNGPRPERFERSERPSFSSSPDVSGQLKEINAKLDAIIEALES